MLSNDKHELVVREYVANGGNKYNAYNEIYKPTNLPAAKKSCDSLFARPDVKERIGQLGKLVAEHVAMDAADVLREFIAIWRADPAELTRVQYLSCRHCWGTDGHYQWANAHEFARATAAWLDLPAKQRTEATKPNDKGGYGFTPHKPGNKECTHCWGMQRDLWIAATDELSPSARRLYQGAKMTKNGIEVLQMDRAAALNNIGKILGMFVDKTKEVPPDTPDADFLQKLVDKLPD